MKYFRFIMFSLFIFLFSCNETRNLTKQSNELSPIIFIINDFSTFEKNKKGCAYKIKLLNRTENIDCYLVSKDQLYFPKIGDSIGAKTKSFPTSFLEVNQRLYLWEDYEKPISKELIKNMAKYGILDSTFIKKHNEYIVKDNFPLIYTNEKEMSFFYFVCKNNYTNYVKRKSNIIIKEKDYPLINCN